MSKFWNVELKYIGVVYADNELDARTVAYSEASEIAWDSLGPTVDVTHEIEKASDFEDGWDGECIAYGGDGNKRIQDYAPELKKV